MPPDRDVQAFDERASRYEQGWRCRLHHEISDRVLVPGCRLVLTDQFSALLWPTLAGSRRGKARTKARATRLVTRAGLHSPHWHALYAVIIQTVTATK